MGKVIHFEIPAEDPKKAVDFYKEVFNWEINKWEGEFEYYLVKAGEDDKPGANGAIFQIKQSPIENVNSFISTIAVDSIDETLEKIKKAGGKVTTEKMQIENVGMFAYCEDPHGIVFGVIEPTAM